VKLKTNTVKDLGFLIIEDVYSESELELVWNEIKHVDYILDHVFDEKAKEEHRKSHNGMTDEGNSRMTGFGFSLDSLYSNREYSVILKYASKLVGKEISETMAGINGENTAYKQINWYFTLLNKYKSGEMYNKHQDSAAFSSLIFLSKEDIQGGGLEFCDYKTTVPFKNNSCVIFPSRVYHQTESFTSKAERYSIAQFMNVKYYTDRNAGN
tara:strand:+ start:68 stop:700 length:633 start_codon:yes stop_codon:yes gene_type:complete